MRIITTALIVVFIVGLCVPASATAASHKDKTTVAAPVASGQLQLFASESAAQAHCPREVVVWLNTNSGIYHEEGMRWYGSTKHGAYVCRKEADAAGDRDTRNGQ